MRRPSIRLIACLAAAVFLGGAHLWSQTRRDFLVPDIPGFITLKGDFHIHTTTSDGAVLPAVRVREAWRDGLDVIALTDHIEFPPPSPDPQPDWNRPYDIAKPVADQYGVLLVRAAEITSSMPPGHFNAFFLDDVTRLKQPTVMAGLQAAAEQGAFIIWNHPGWKAQQPDVTRWFPEHTDLYQRGWLKGIEVVNEKEFYPIVHQWAVEKKLTLFANSDVHDAIDFLYAREKGEQRPLTLVFARARSVAAVREAFDQRRTATYYDDTLIGDIEHLRPLVLASLKVLTPRVSVSDKKTAAVLVTNGSDLPFRLVPVKSEAFGVAVSDVLGPRSTIALSLTDLARLETGEHSLTLRFEVANVLVGPATPLVVDLPVVAFAWGRVRPQPAEGRQWTIDCGRTTPGIDVRYTLDGSMPGPASPTVARAFPASNAIGVKLAAFKDGLQVGGVLEDRFDLHSAIGQKATLAHPPDKRYAADGALSLVDGRRGSARHTDGRWLGFQRPDLEAVIEFDPPRAATTVSASFLESPRSWIFLPAEVEFLASADGVRYERLGRVVYPEPVEGKGRGVVTAEVKVTPGPPARFLKIVARNAGVCPRWHSAAGQPAWLFVDEIVVR